MKTIIKYILCGLASLLVTLHITGLCILIATGNETLWGITGFIIVFTGLYGFLINCIRHGWF